MRVCKFSFGVRAAGHLVLQWVLGLYLGSLFQEKRSGSNQYLYFQGSPFCRKLIPAHPSRLFGVLEAFARSTRE